MKFPHHIVARHPSFLDIYVIRNVQEWTEVLSLPNHPSFLAFFRSCIFVLSEGKGKERTAKRKEMPTFPSPKRAWIVNTEKRLFVSIFSFTSLYFILPICMPYMYKPYTSPA